MAYPLRGERLEGSTQVLHSNCGFTAPPLVTGSAWSTWLSGNRAQGSRKTRTAVSYHPHGFKLSASPRPREITPPHATPAAVPCGPKETRYARTS